MIAICVLLVLLVAATWTDCRQHRIYNWNTYPGMLAAPLLLWSGLGLQPAGMDALTDSVMGFFACGFIMLAAFVFFEMGGGDVKLVAMMGAFLGLECGIEALLWTFTIGFILGLSVVIWQQGTWSLLSRGVRHVQLVCQARGWIAPTQEERQPLQRGLFLAPAALLGTIVAAWRLMPGSF